jgi:cell division protease FtsH
MANDKKNEFKRNIPSGFVWFLMAAFFMAILLQNYIETKFAKVSFSYQLEHLVNLQLLQPEDNKKTALNDNLVTFSGQFREKQTEEGKNRFKFLELLNTNHQLHQDQTRIDNELTENRTKILSSGDYFLHLSGIPIPKDGYVIVDGLYNTPPKDNSVVIKELSKRSIQSLPDVKAEFANLKETPSEAFFKKFGKSLSDLIRNFRSLELGIGNEAIKEKLKTLDADVANLNQAGNLKNLTPYETVLGELQFIVNDLNEVEDHIRLMKLRSVRSYKKALDENSDIAQKVDENETQLDKARQAVSGVVWFFNNQELSTRSLEKQDPDQFAQWFNNAKEEWTRFPQNAGGFFKAPDQPLNTALEKTFKSEEPAPNYLSYLFTIMPVLLVLGVLYLVFSRQMKGMGSNAMSFGKSPARLVLPEGPNKVTFKDVAGADEAIEELQEIVEFLKNPQHFTTLGGRIPKGVLCIGPPGTGKTLLAKAVAGEADRPFFSISGSDFVEMFVGVGASRIRDLFDQAKKSAPCIVFIDEIDAVGRHRGAGIGGGHDEREQTLNQLLVEMDGFDTNEGVILMAATNRPDVLDKALLRPGRFDRRVVVSLPDVKGRYDILKVHARKIKMDASVDLMSIARSTPGSSGADLANILNEAALLAARRGRTAVTAQEAQEARDKVLYGKERRSLEIDENEKLTTAYHETGHTIVGLVVKHSDPVDKVSIIPRGMSLGSTMFLPKKNRLSYWRNEILDQLAVLMGGRCAEEIFVHDVSSGAQQDIERATQLARSMVCEWGMSDKLGAVAYTDRETQQMGFGSKEKAYSEETARAIDQEVKQLLDEAHKKAKEILEQHREQVELMTQMLMEFETLDSEDIELIMKGTWSVEEKKRKLKLQEELHKQQMSPPPPPPPVTEQEKSINNLPRPTQEPTS